MILRRARPAGAGGEGYLRARLKAVLSLQPCRIEGGAAGAMDMSSPAAAARRRRNEAATTVPVLSGGVHALQRSAASPDSEDPMRGVAAVLAGTLAIVACADEVPRQSPPEFVEAPPREGYVGEAAAGADDATAPGTPAGGYLDWIADLRAGLHRVAAVAVADRETALREVQELYASRHEYLQIYFGDGGAMYVNDELAQAVERSADAFRSLIRQLASMAEDDAAVEDAVAGAARSLDEVESAAHAAGLPADAPRTQ
jgi:hypothetical protein